MKLISLPYFKPNPKKLLRYGFLKAETSYRYETSILNGSMLMTVLIEQDKCYTEVIDLDLNEEFSTHHVIEATGEFIGQVRKEHNEVLERIVERCFETTIFQESQSIELIEYVRNTYGDEPEYLWEKFPRNAVWRRRDNDRWYGAILTAKGKTIGLDTDELVEVLDIRIDPIELDLLVDNKTYFRGYHMNKKHWCTMRLDGSVSTEELKERIEESYHLAK